MSFCFAESCFKKSLDQLPCVRLSNDARSETEDVHVVILDALMRGKMIVTDRSASARNLVRRDAGADAAAANGNAAFDLPCSDASRQWHHEIGVVIARVKKRRTEISHFVAREA